MAFDHPLESDRVDDLSLFSFFLRAPVVGTIMWIIGGDMAKQREEEEKASMVKQELLGDSHVGHRQLTDSRRYADTKHKKKIPPQLLGSEISHFGDVATGEEATVMQRSSSSEGGRDLGLRRTKKMSWSDESGQSLVVYINENEDLSDSSSGSAVVSSGSSINAKPVKSAMRRSGSVKEATTTLDRGSTERSSLAPNRFGGGQNGLVMPTKPFSESNTGHVSPEWGWYTNLTPPTPEMYGRAPTQKASKETSSVSHPKAPAELTPLSNPAFGRSNRAAAGWPSVPL